MYARVVMQSTTEKATRKNYEQHFHRSHKPAIGAIGVVVWHLWRPGTQVYSAALARDTRERAQNFESSTCTSESTSEKWFGVSKPRSKEKTLQIRVLGCSAVLRAYKIPLPNQILAALCPQLADEAKHGCSAQYP
jgi:hypothetical protein